jgi:uncharacterized protein (TIGR03643 family)
MERKIYQISEIIELAWDDKVSFDSILEITGLPEKEVIALMRSEMKPSSFRMWRKRVGGRVAKHRAKSSPHSPQENYNQESEE